MQRVLDLVGLKHRQREQFVGRRHRQHLILFGAQPGQPVPGLRRDHDARTAFCNDVAEGFKHERRAVQVDVEDRGRRCLRRRDAGGVDQSDDVTARGGHADERLHRRAR